MANSEWRIDNDGCFFARFATSYSLLTIRPAYAFTSAR
jgi:hypothetical protein